MRRIIESRSLIAIAASAATGLFAFFQYPFPVENAYLQLVRLESPAVYASFFYGYRVLLFTTPFILFSSVLSLLFVVSGAPRSRTRSGALPRYPRADTRDRLFVVVGEVHHPTKAVPVDNPSWLTLPDRGLFTGVAVVGAVGTGKTSCCMRPFAEQLFAYKAHDPERRIGGLVLEVKGGFCREVREVLARNGRAEDYVEISLDSPYTYNPLASDVDPYALAYAITSLMANLYGKGKEPFWAMASTNLVKFIILLHRLVDDYVTLFDVYVSAIEPARLGRKLEEGRARLKVIREVLVTPEVFHSDVHFERLDRFPFVFDPSRNFMVAEHTPEIQATLTALRAPHEVRVGAPADSVKARQFEAVERWFQHDWMAIDERLRTSIVEGIAVFLSVFDDNPSVNRVFCPPQAPTCEGKLFPSFSWLIESGKVCALNFPVSANPGLSKAIGTLMKMDYQRAVLLRIPEIAAHPERHFRETVFLCDEYHSFATCGEDNPNGDEKFFALSRQAKCIPIVATQSISSLKTTLPGDTYRTLLQTLRTKIFLALSDDLSIQMASELCGKEDRAEVSYNISENSYDATVSVLTGKTFSNKGGFAASKTYGVRHMERFTPKTFAELKNAQAIVLPYDGVQPMEATLCYLKPYYLDPDVSWFEHARRGLI